MSNQNDKAQNKGAVNDDDVVDVFNDEEVIEVEEDDNDSKDKSQSDADKAKSKEEDEFVLPEKFKGKSIQDVVESYTNLEKEYGRRNSEIGEQRKIIDKLLDLERPQSGNKDEAEDKVVVDADSLLENPQEAIRKVIETDPTLKGLRESEVKRLRAEEKSQFEKDNPDYKDILKSDQFAEWILKSERRKALFVKADQSYDYGAMSDILSDYRELYPATSADNEAEDADEKEEQKEKDLKKITTEKRGNSRTSQKKYYSREQLVELRVQKPEEYARRSAEFNKAYAEGRVLSQAQLAKRRK